MADIRIAALAGGVGGAKLAHGLAQVLQPEQVTVIVNTADDFKHLGLWISPDLDTVCYTLAGVADPVRGWGRKNESWSVFKQLKQLGMPDWFQVGDTDLATHLFRTARLEEGESLSQITQELCRLMGIKVNILPMSDDVVQTRIITDQGELEFQEYFVHLKCAPVMKEVKFTGIEEAEPAPGVLNAIQEANWVVFCPSNPWVSIDPVLAVPGIRAGLEGKCIIAVSPIIGSQTIKGPAAKMFSEMGIQPSALAIAQHYGSLVDCLAIDRMDENLKAEIEAMGIRTYVCDIVMHDEADRGRLANEIIEFINGWEGGQQ